MLVNLRATHFELFRESFQVRHQFLMSLMSACNSLEQSKPVIGLKSLVSSANTKTEERAIVYGRSLIYIMKRRGPRMLPWGTPEITGR